VADSSLRWSYNVGSTVRNDPLYHEELCYVGTEDGHLYALDTATGEPEWQFDAPNGIATVAMGGDVMTVANGTLYVLSSASSTYSGSENVLHALDPATGAEHWRTDLDVTNWIGILGVADDAVVLGSNNDGIGPCCDPALAVETATGAIRWRAEAGSASGGAFDDENAYVAVPGRLYAFSLDDGSERWRHDGPEFETVRVVADGEHVYFYTSEIVDRTPTSWVRALSPEDGSVRWEHSEWYVTSMRLGDALYLGGEHVAKLGPDGTEQWRYKDGGLIHDAPLTDKTLFVFRSGTVVALATDDGTERWRIETAVEYAIPRAVDDGVVVLRDDRRGALYGHDAASGDHRWTLTLGEDRVRGPVVGDGAVFAVTRNGRVVARDL
jgi:outer membrane protein assembly factor BamB